MNNDLISREALKRDLIDNYSFYPAIVKNALEKQPTISPDSLRPKGRWEQIGYDDVLDRITCSHCKEYWNIPQCLCIQSSCAVITILASMVGHLEKRRQ